MTTAKWLLVQALLFQQAVAGFAFVVVINRNNNHPDSRYHLATTTTRTTILLQQSTSTAVAEPTTTSSLEAPVAVKPSSLPSVLRPSTMTRAHTEQWQQALVPRPWENPRGADVTVQWDAAAADDEYATVAQQLLRDARKNDDPILQSDLTASLQAFTAFCREHSDVLSSSSSTLSSPLRLKARLVATRGSPLTKCPQWHLDHVPVRWIQALTGPGCLWIANPDEAVCWDRINALNDNDNDDDDDDIVLDDTSNDRNQLLVDATRAVVEQAAPGEAVLLLGQEWPDPSVRPAVHKSPEIQRPWQGRVLLTMDVVLDDDDCC